MEPNEKELDVEDEEIDEELEEPEELRDENDQDITDWKAEALKRHGIAKRYQTKLRKIKTAEAEKAKTEAEKAKQPQDKKEFDYAEKAYLRSMGVEKEDFPFVFETTQKTGKTLDELLDSKYFQAELKEKREERESQEAIPSGTKRTSGSARDSVEYWIAKGELPPADQVELRRKVVKAKVDAERNKSHFSANPIV